MRTRTITATVALMMTAVLGLPTPPVSAADSGGVLAAFEGTTINLQDGWGAARACTSNGTVTTCYRSEAAMDRATAVSARSTEITPLAACSSSLRLYRSTSYGGSVLQLTTRYTYINLSGYGFENDTSSYKVGACSAGFYDGSGGGAPAYPGNTGANASATSMVSGWDNRVSSVYIA
ncbi:MAG TPA: hypothetical protein VES40_05045 [Ilumatobacteraceae bacterium]|jgi:hypothetical protein|nr:hypothetical protein [Ilumatobacteraceae bacterium]